ncbi:hypothetical protein BH09ACT10_BH09ACT10_06980 [soil metagenome]
MTVITPGPKSRMSASDRRALVLQAAMRAFAREGYFGTTTHAIALEAGVSQPYVVRIFGTKLELFLEVFAGAAEGIRKAFQDVLDSGPFDPESDADWERLGMSYSALIEDRNLLLVLMHGFNASDVHEIGAQARRGMSEIYTTITSSGCSAEQARDFIAHGMLLNVLTAIGTLEHPAELGPLAELAQCSFGEAPRPDAISVSFEEVEAFRSAARSNYDFCMLAMSSYPQTYIDTCRARTASQVKAFGELAAATTVPAEVEIAFFNNLVIVLDSYFAHRTRGVEKKDGNPINEVRVLVASLVTNGEVMGSDSTIAMKPEKSVLGHKVGDPIKVSAQDFALLSEAYFADIEKKFGAA